ASELLSIVFFFSSRRRHTRSKRDWSSDVCSSDLPAGGPCPAGVQRSNSCRQNAPRFTARPPTPCWTTPHRWTAWCRKPYSWSMRSEERRVGKEWRTGGGPGGRKDRRKGGGQVPAS